MFGALEMQRRSRCKIRAKFPKQLVVEVQSMAAARTQGRALVGGKTRARALETAAAAPRRRLGALRMRIYGVGQVGVLNDLEAGGNLVGRECEYFSFAAAPLHTSRVTKGSSRVSALVLSTHQCMHVCASARGAQNVNVSIAISITITITITITVTITITSTITITITITITNYYRAPCRTTRMRTSMPARRVGRR